MSFFPSPVLVKLQELKLWQGNYDSLLQNKSKRTNASDFETIEGISALDSTLSSSLSSPERNVAIDWDKKAISPVKPFEQLLEEKLAQDKPVQVQAKPKRSFLKKGSGLTRYKLNQQPSLARRRTQSKTTVQKTRENEQNRLRKHSSEFAPLKSCLKSPILLKHRREESQIDLTPLRMPDIAIRPKATWRKVLEEENVNVEENTEKSSSSAYQNSFNSQVIGKINDFNLKRLLPLSPRRNIIQRRYSESITTIPEVESEKSIPRDEQSVENELRIFEALEERVEHSSFSSTNSSIMRLLSSTPNKPKSKLPSTRLIVEEPKVVENEGIPSGYHVQGFQNTLLQQKLNEVNKRTDVLHDFLNNLRKIGNNNDRRSSVSSAESVQQRSPETSFSDEEKWSSNTDVDRSVSPSSSFTDTFKASGLQKVDAAVNTSFEEKVECVKDNKCENCDELRTKLERVSKQLPDIQAEKARVCDFAKELEVKRDQLFKDMEKMREKHEKVISELKQELDNEKRRFAREKTVFDMYVKDSQNRPSKKEREEISDLKKELADCKELLKLKETKNGATQARLRTQIKQLEKETNELKQVVEKLQKENSKLNATQLMRRPSEVKMLHEINRNLTKLTEETLKKQTNKTDTSCNTDSLEDVKKRCSKKSKEVDIDSNDRTIPAKKNSYSNCDDLEGSGSVNETSKNELTTFANLSLEKQYESVFGMLPSFSSNNNTLNDSKKERTETVFEDGSKEIKYGNGNTKTISPDGNLVVVKYYNGDVKETNLTKNTLKYYYAENGTWHIHYDDGTEVLEYPNGQREKTYKDGRREVKCTDGSFLFRTPDGTEEIVYPDGSKIIKHPDGEKVLLLPNGQKEVHTKEHKRREYPDGTVKILYPDGTQETRYASGRIRIKDGNGVLVMDSQNPSH